LHTLPFHALPLHDGTCLADRFVTATVPATRHFTVPARPDTVTPGRVLVVGNPAPPTGGVLPDLPAADLVPLPGAADEAVEIAGMYGATPLLGAAATTDAVLARLPGSQIAHLATHALPGDEALAVPAALCLAPGPDGRCYLLEQDLHRLDLSALRIVVLSACDTAWGRISGEGSIGLGRAFLDAGAGCVLMSLWPVLDRATRRLMTDVHRRLLVGERVGEAVRAAQLDARADPRSADVWASFLLLGSPGVRITAG
jgi:CHAT domain-containing protein